jgi:hypothetical protein
MPVVRATNLSKPQQNAARGKLDYEIPFFGGWNSTSDPSSSPPTTSSPDGMPEVDSPDALNVVYDTVNSVMSRKGYTKLLTTKLSNPIYGMYPFYQSTGVKQLVYMSGAYWWNYNNAGGSTQITGTPTSFTPNQPWDMDELLDDVYGGNGIDPLVVYNGTAISVANAAISPQFVKIHKNRAYCANRNSSTLYFSDAGTPSSFPVNNFIAINTNDGQNITAIDDLLDNLVIFKDESVWIITGEPVGAGNTTTIGNLQLKQANSPVGCSAFNTVQKVQQTLFFMHYSGIYMLENLNVKLISPFLKTTFSQGMNASFLNLAWAVYNALENKYILGYPSSSSTTCDSAIVYDLTTNQYSRWDHMPGSCAINFKFAPLKDTVLMGDPNIGTIYELFQGYADIYGDNGVASSGSTTTLTDNTKNWATNALVDARVLITAGPGQGQIFTVISNTSDQITFATQGVAIGIYSSYTIGYYDSHWVTKNFDFGMTGYTKKYRFGNIFLDSELYPIQIGISIDFQALKYQKTLNLVSGALVWGPPLVWGPATGSWGSFSSEFAQFNINQTGRYIQCIFGNNLANQPWRIIKYSFEYKLKKVRPQILSV